MAARTGIFAAVMLRPFLKHALLFFFIFLCGYARLLAVTESGKSAANVTPANEITQSSFSKTTYSDHSKQTPFNRKFILLIGVQAPDLEQDEFELEFSQSNGTTEIWDYSLVRLSHWLVANWANNYPSNPERSRWLYILLCLFQI